MFAVILASIGMLLCQKHSQNVQTNSAPLDNTFIKQSLVMSHSSASEKHPYP